MSKWTPKKEKFCLHYFENGKASDAYKHAYSYSKMKIATISNNAYKLLQRNDVITRLQELRDKAANDAVMTKQEALERLSNSARVTVDDIAVFSEQVIGEDENGNPVTQAAWRIKNSDEINPKALSAIKSVTATKMGPKLEMHDPQAAIKQLADLLGWNAPKETNITGDLNLSTKKTLDDFYDETQSES
ncbi:MAG: terminase small subunit [Glaciecola sp.]|jgi:phage terminase small subunit